MEKITLAELTQEQLDQLYATLETTTEENEALTKANDALTAQVEELSNAAKASPVSKPISVSKETFEVDGITYGFKLAAVIFNDHKITCDHVLANKQLQQKLIDAGSGMIIKK